MSLVHWGSLENQISSRLLKVVTSPGRKKRLEHCHEKEWIFAQGTSRGNAAWVCHGVKEEADCQVTARFLLEQAVQET